MQLFSFPRLETLSLRGLRISELVAVARIFKLLIYPGDFVARENGEFVAEGLPMSHFAPFLTKPFVVHGCNRDNGRNRPVDFLC